MLSFFKVNGINYGNVITNSNLWGTKCDTFKIVRLKWNERLCMNLPFPMEINILFSYWGSSMKLTILMMMWNSEHLCMVGNWQAFFYISNIQTFDINIAWALFAKLYTRWHFQKLMMLHKQLDYTTLFFIILWKRD